MFYGSEERSSDSFRPIHKLLRGVSVHLYFVHPIFRFWFWVTFADKVMKILRNLCLHFARQDGQDGKTWKENHSTKATKIPKTKRR